MHNNPLSEIFIDGFRNLRRLTLESLGQINILVGANNSGKTSVLEAISVLCNPQNPSEWLNLIRRRDFVGLDRSRLQPLRWCFYRSAMTADFFALHEGKCELRRRGNSNVRLVVDYAEMLREPDPSEHTDAPGAASSSPTTNKNPRRGARITHSVVLEQQEVTNSEIRKSLVIWEAEGTRHKSRRRRHAGGTSLAISSATMTPYDYQISRPNVEQSSRQEIVELVRKFDPDVLDIIVESFEGFGASTYVAHSKLGLAPLYIFGDAFRRALLLATKIQRLKDGGVMLIDELEAGIHVDALAPVFSWLTNAASEHGVQIIATTHSLEAVDGILKGATSSDDIVTYHLDQNPDHTQAKRLSGELAKRLREDRGLDIR